LGYGDFKKPLEIGAEKSIFSSRVSEKHMSEAGIGFVLVVVGSFARNFILGFRMEGMVIVPPWVTFHFTIITSWATRRLRWISQSCWDIGGVCGGWDWKERMRCGWRACRRRQSSCVVL